MNANSTTDTIKKIFQGERLRYYLRPSLVILFFCGVALVFLSAAVFLYETIGTAVEKPADDGGKAIRIDTELFSEVAPRFGIVLPQHITTDMGDQTTAPDSEEINKPTATPPPATAVATASSTDKIVAHSIIILNGTNIPGLAKQWETRFRDAGFDVQEVGNAEKRDYEGFTLLYGSSLPPSLPLIKETLTKYEASLSAEKEGEGSDTAPTLIIGK